MKVNLSSESSIFEDYISAIVLNIESIFKEELALILNLVFRLPTNAPRFAHIFQGWKSGVGSTNGSGNDTCLVVGNVLSTQILTTIPIKPISSIATTKTTNDPQEHMDCLGLQKMEISISEGGLSSTIVKTASTVGFKYKWKGIHV